MTETTEQNQIQNETETAVSEAFNSLPKNKTKDIREEIMRVADIKEATFYRILKGYRPKAPIRMIFAEILKQDESTLFPLTNNNK